MLLLYSSFASGGSFRQASRRICNPALKNVLTYLGSADLQSAAKEYALPFIGGLQIPRCYRSNLFLRRISNPPGRLADLRSWRRLAGLRSWRRLAGLRSWRRLADLRSWRHLGILGLSTRPRLTLSELMTHPSRSFCPLPFPSGCDRWFWVSVDYVCAWSF